MGLVILIVALASGLIVGIISGILSIFIPFNIKIKTNTKFERFLVVSLFSGGTTTVLVFIYMIIQFVNSVP